jgi:AraC-like DNA-binding protein
MNAEGGREAAYAFYAFIERLFAEGSCDSTSSAALPEDVALAVTFINENIASKITVSEIAERAGVNITTLERHFAAVFRIPPLEYIKKKRLGEAERLISDGVSVTDACYKSGFSDLSKFIITFRRHFGKTPKQYQLEIEREKKLKKD